MSSINRLHTDPIRTPRSRRNHNISVLTSFQPGVCAPVLAMPMLREDSLSARFQINVEMNETHELLVNSVNLRATAYLVPWTAFDRYQHSRDQFDRSYMGQPAVDGGAVVPFFETYGAPAVGSNAIHKSLGLHYKPGDAINTMYDEAYNQIINMRLKNRSPNLTKRTRLASTLAPAFWLNSQFEHVVPDFDQAIIDGEVALNYDVAGGRIPVKGMLTSPTAAAAGTVLTHNADGATGVAGTNTHYNVLAGKTVAGMGAQVFAEMVEGGLKISLASLELAKKTQAFAKMRESYQGLMDGNVSDEYIIDMLMSGLTIPDQDLFQPILLGDQVVKFGQAKRYATDYVNMAESAVSGAASINMSIRCPQLDVGGIVMVMLEALPDQLFERQMDPFLYTGQVSNLPDFLRDELDVQKVDIVTNRQIDVDHSTPAATFGYEPMNAKWNRWGPRIGGKFHKPLAVTSNDAWRERLWAIEQADPALGASFYLVSNMNKKPFLDTVNDPFEVAVSGVGVLEGLTRFGDMLVEQTNLYDKVMAKAPTTQAKAN